MCNYVRVCGCVSDPLATREGAARKRETPRDRRGQEGKHRHTHLDVTHYKFVQLKPSSLFTLNPWQSMKAFSKRHQLSLSGPCLILLRTQSCQCMHADFAFAQTHTLKHTHTHTEVAHHSQVVVAGANCCDDRLCWLSLLFSRSQL